jgi:heat shock protein HtpX
LKKFRKGDSLFPPATDSPEIRAHQRRNLAQTIVLTAGMTLLLGALGWLLGGPVSVIWAVIVGLTALAIGTRASAGLLLRLYRARPIPRDAAPQLHAIVDEVAERAGLVTSPSLFLIPSRMMQAFSSQLRDGPAIAVTDGLLRGMTAHEIAAVIAHETSHIAHRDLRIMMLADLTTKLTRTFAFVGTIMVIVMLPMMMAGYSGLPWGSLILLIFAPSLSTLMQLALSRTREFDADLSAARLTGDPTAMAKALVKLERFQGGAWEQVLLPGYRLPEPSLLRSHPETDERVRRLCELPQGAPLKCLTRLFPPSPHAPVTVIGGPRWRRTGFWY